MTESLKQAKRQAITKALEDQRLAVDAKLKKDKSKPKIKVPKAKSTNAWLRKPKFVVRQQKHIPPKASKPTKAEETPIPLSPPKDEDEVPPAVQEGGGRKEPMKKKRTKRRRKRVSHQSAQTLVRESDAYAFPCSIISHVQ
jgi:hypothetical protein